MIDFVKVKDVFGFEKEHMINANRIYSFKFYNQYTDMYRIVYLNECDTPVDAEMEEGEFVLLTGGCLLRYNKNYEES